MSDGAPTARPARGGTPPSPLSIPNPNLGNNLAAACQHRQHCQSAARLADRGTWPRVRVDWRGNLIRGRVGNHFHPIQQPGAPPRAAGSESECEVPHDCPGLFVKERTGEQMTVAVAVDATQWAGNEINLIKKTLEGRERKKSPSS